MKKILYIIEEDISIDGGSGINERGLVKSLLENGLCVLIPKPEFQLEAAILGHSKLYMAKSLNRRNLLSYFTYMINKVFLITKITRIENIDVYVFRWGPIPLDVLFLGMFSKKKIFLKHLTFLRTSQSDGIVFKIGAIFRKMALQRNYISGGDTPSLATRQLIRNEYNIKNVLVAKNGTDIVEDIEQMPRSKEFLYIGRLSKKRNTDLLLNAFQNSGRKIDIYGFGEMESIVKEWAEKNDNINFYGKVDFESLKKEIPKYKFGVDFTFVPTDYGKASYSQKIAQYLSFGLNVVAVNCEDNEFIEQKNVGVLVDLEKDCLASKIDNINYKPFNPEVVKEYIYNDDILKQRLKFWNE